MLPVLLGCWSHGWNTQRAPRTYGIFVNKLFHLSTATGVCFYEKSPFSKVVVTFFLLSCSLPAEYYPNCEVVFMGMANIHSIRKSFQSLRLLCTQMPDPGK